MAGYRCILTWRFLGCQNPRSVSLRFCCLSSRTGWCSSCKPRGHTHTSQRQALLPEVFGKPWGYCDRTSLCHLPSLQPVTSQGVSVKPRSHVLPPPKSGRKKPHKGFSHWITTTLGFSYLGTLFTLKFWGHWLWYYMASDLGFSLLSPPTPLKWGYHFTSQADQTEKTTKKPEA